MSTVDDVLPGTRGVLRELKWVARDIQTFVVMRKSAHRA